MTLCLSSSVPHPAAQSASPLRESISRCAENLPPRVRGKRSVVVGIIFYFIERASLCRPGRTLLHWSLLTHEKSQTHRTRLPRRRAGYSRRPTLSHYRSASAPVGLHCYSVLAYWSHCSVRVWAVGHCTHCRHAYHDRREMDNSFCPRDNCTCLFRHAVAWAIGS